MTNLLTVIIPTLCKEQRILNAILQECEKCEEVKEVLVFDNTLGSFTCELPKIRIFSEKNLYVNPSWNKGVEIATTPYYLLLNDDVIITSETIRAGVQLLHDNKSFGLVSISTHNIAQNEVDYYLQTRQEFEEADFTLRDEDSEFFSGWCIFGKKELWEKIPHRLVYFMGDNWIFDVCRKKKKKAAIITNHIIYHLASTTCNVLNKYNDGTLQKEKEIYRSIISSQNSLKSISPEKNENLETLQTNHNHKDPIHMNFQLAWTYAGNKQYEKALEYLFEWEKEAIKKNIDLSLGFSVYLSCMFNLKKYKEAVAHVTPYISQCMHSADFCLNLGACYYEIEEYDEALKIIERIKQEKLFSALASNALDTLWKAHIISGNCCIQLREFKKAIECFESAYAIHKKIDILQCLIDTSYKLADVDRIEKYLKEMRILFPKHKNLKNDVMYANLLFNKGAVEESITKFLELPNGIEYVEQLINGLTTLKRYNDVDMINSILKNHTNSHSAIQ